MSLYLFHPHRETRQFAKAPFVLVGALCLGLAQNPCCAAPNAVIGEFESASYEGWKTTGTAFGNGPALGARLPQLEVQSARGNGVASSELAGDSPTGTLTSPPFKIEARYIAFAIGGGAYDYRTCANLLVGGKLVRSTTGTNSDRLLPASWDVSPFKGQTAQIQLVDSVSGEWGHINVDHIIQTDQPEHLPVVTPPLYQEKFRPQFHFTARQWATTRLNPGQHQEGWMNDLNGLVYYDGEYHLFAQRWWSCWIHAVSKDLIHWTELPPAFWEEKPNMGVQSGTIVIDYANTSGLSPDKRNPPMVAFCTRNDDRTHLVTYSLDHGRTWRFYDKNPILVKPERDPNVFWYQPGAHWVMMMYGEGQYHILTSRNLLEWKDEHHTIPNSYECPNFFELPVDGDHNHKKWVLVRGDGKYSVGSFDGTQFTEETPQFVSDFGPNFYATQTWANTETGDDRRIQAAWMRGGAYPDMPFNQQASFPCELTLRTTPSGPRLFREPIREIATLHKSETKWTQRVLKDGATLSLAPTGDLFHLKMQVRVAPGATLTLNVRGVPLALTHRTLANDTEPVPTSGELQTVEVLIDRTSLEAFANGGEVSISRCFLPSGDGLSLQVRGGGATIQSLSLFPLNSAWTNKPLPLTSVMLPSP